MPQFGQDRESDPLRKLAGSGRPAGALQLHAKRALRYVALMARIKRMCPAAQARR